MKKLSILNFILAVLLGLNIFILHSPILGVVLGLVFIGLSSYLLDRLFNCLGETHSTSSGQAPRRANVLFGFLLFLCIVILPLTAVYYFYQLNDWVIAGFLILFSVVLLVLSKKNNYQLPITNYQLPITNY